LSRGVARVGPRGARPVHSADEVAPPARVLDLEGPGAAAVRADRHSILQDRTLEELVRPLREALVALLPPPAPIELVEGDVDLAAALHELAVAVHEREVDALILVDQEHAPRRVALGQAEAHIARVGVEVHAGRLAREYARRLEHPREYVGGELPGGQALVGGQVDAEAGAALAVEAVVEEDDAVGGDGPGRVVESI